RKSTVKADDYRFLPRWATDWYRHWKSDKGWIDCDRFRHYARSLRPLARLSVKLRLQLVWAQLVAQKGAQFYEYYISEFVSSIWVKSDRCFVRCFPADASFLYLILANTSALYRPYRDRNPLLFAVGFLYSMSSLYLQRMFAIRVNFLVLYFP